MRHDNDNKTSSERTNPKTIDDYPYELRGPSQNRLAVTEHHACAVIAETHMDQHRRADGYQGSQPVKFRWLEL